MLILWVGGFLYAMYSGGFGAIALATVVGCLMGAFVADIGWALTGNVKWFFAMPTAALVFGWVRLTGPDVLGWFRALWD